MHYLHLREVVRFPVEKYGYSVTFPRIAALHADATIYLIAPNIPSVRFLPCK